METFSLSGVSLSDLRCYKGRVRYWKVYLWKIPSHGDYYL